MDFTRRSIGLAAAAAAAFTAIPARAKAPFLGAQAPGMLPPQGRRI